MSANEVQRQANEALKALSQIIGFCACSTGQCREDTVCWTIARQIQYSASSTYRYPAPSSVSKIPHHRPCRSGPLTMSKPNLLLVGRRSLLALVALLSSSVGVAGRTRLSAGCEATGAHVFASFGLCNLLVSVEEGKKLGWIYLARLDPGGISLGHLAALSRHVDGLQGGLASWKLVGGR